VFRRRSAAEAAPDEPPPDAVGKNRPTPTRKEAEAARKARLKPSTDRRSATKAARAEARANRERTRRALLEGDVRHLPVRDQGPARAAARDLVDSRRTLGELMLPAVLVFLVLSFVPSNVVRGWAILGFYLFMLMVMVDTAYVGWRVNRVVRREHPDDSRGVGMYAALRALQFRRLRLPRPRTRAGGRPPT